MRLIPKNDLTPDGWTYGDWTQWVAWLDHDHAQCCRRAFVPTVCSMIGVVLIGAMLLAVVFVPGKLNSAGWFLLWLGGALQAFVAIELATRSLWMVMLGPVMPRTSTGFWRIFPGEEL